MLALAVAAAAGAAATAFGLPGPEPGPSRTTGDFAPLWSPDGKAIAFARIEEGDGIFIVGVDGRGIRRR